MGPKVPVVTTSTIRAGLLDALLVSPYPTTSSAVTTTTLPDLILSLISSRLLMAVSFVYPAATASARLAGPIPLPLAPNHFGQGDVGEKVHQQLAHVAPHHVHGAAAHAGRSSWRPCTHSTGAKGPSRLRTISYREMLSGSLESRVTTARAAHALYQARSLEGYEQLLKIFGGKISWRSGQIP